MQQPRRERAWRHVQVLCEEIGPRLSGTPGDDRAVEHIARHMAQCGLEVEVQDYPCPGWDHTQTELALLHGGRRGPLQAVAQTFSADCDVEAELASWRTSAPGANSTWRQTWTGRCWCSTVSSDGA